MVAMRSLIVVHMVISYLSLLRPQFSQSSNYNFCCTLNDDMALHFSFTHSKNNKKGIVSPWEYRLLMVIDIVSALIVTPPVEEDQVFVDIIDESAYDDQVFVDIIDESAYDDQVSVDIIDEVVSITDNIDSNATRSDDMYGVGVALMEIITGKPMCQIGEGVQFGLLTQWVSSMFEEGEIGSIVDPKLRGEFDIKSMEEAIKIGVDCVSQNSAHHPTMDQLVAKLEHCLQIERARLIHEGQPFGSFNLNSMEISLNETN